MKIKILFIMLFTTSCQILPKYDMYEIEYCRKIRGVIYCEGKPAVNMNPEFSCSVYDDLCEEL